MEGGKIHEFLLEKSRLVQQDSKERNYHSFYCLLLGASAKLKEDLHLTGQASHYNYLSQGGLIHVDSMDDAAMFEKLKVNTWTWRWYRIFLPCSLPSTTRGSRRLNREVSSE